MIDRKKHVEGSTEVQGLQFQAATGAVRIAKSQEEDSQIVCEVSAEGEGAGPSPSQRPRKRHRPVPRLLRACLGRVPGVGCLRRCGRTRPPQRIRATRPWRCCGAKRSSAQSSRRNSWQASATARRMGTPSCPLRRAPPRRPRTSPRRARARRVPRPGAAHRPRGAGRGGPAGVRSWRQRRRRMRCATRSRRAWRGARTAALRAEARRAKALRRRSSQPRSRGPPEPPPRRSARGATAAAAPQHAIAPARTLTSRPPVPPAHPPAAPAPFRVLGTVTQRRFSQTKSARLPRQVSGESEGVLLPVLSLADGCALAARALAAGDVTPQPPHQK